MIENLSRILLRLDFKSRIIAFNVFMSSLGILVIVSSSYYLARGEITSEQGQRLATIRDMQKRALERWWDNVTTNLRTEASNPATVEAMTEFRRAFEDVAANEGGREGAMRRLQRAYITENSYEKGKKDLLVRATTGGAYDAVHERYHRYYREFLNEHHYYDIFLIDSESGHIVYSVFKELDFATNLLSGEWKDTHIARVFREARASSEADAIFATDFEPYAPSYDDPAYFKATPIIVNGRNEGVLIFQYSQKRLDEFMHGVKGLGRTGETYLVGEDGLFRSNSRLLLKDGVQTLLNPKHSVKNAAVNAAFNGKFGVQTIEGYRGEDVFSAYTNIKLDNNDYALVVELDLAEAYEVLDKMLINWGILTVMILAVVIAGTLFLATRISDPVNEIVSILTSSAHEIAATVDEQESVAQQQSASVNQTTSTMAELGASSQQTAGQAEIVAGGAQEAMTAAREGQEMVDEMQTGMHGIKSKVSAIAEQISHLSEQTHQIGNITSFVGDLANQTNMLALNAAVEAVRAGEHGKGFAVVASEIRKLADQSKKSAERIQNLVSEIQHATDATVMATDEGTKSVDANEAIAGRAAHAFQRVSGEMGRVVENTRQISLNVKQQATAVNEVVQAMTEINTGARESATGAMQTKQGVHQLNTASEKLRLLMTGGASAYDRLFRRRGSDERRDGK
jgi:methyl-accepting chemotaxis protein